MLHMNCEFWSCSLLQFSGCHSLPCPYCSKVIEGEAKLRKHLNKEHQYRSCGQRIYFRSAEYRDHLISEHGANFIVQCNALFDDPGYFGDFFFGL